MCVASRKIIMIYYQLLNPGKLNGKPYACRLWDRISQDCLNTNNLTPHLYITIDTEYTKRSPPLSAFVFCKPRRYPLMICGIINRHNVKCSIFVCTLHTKNTPAKIHPPILNHLSIQRLSENLTLYRQKINYVDQIESIENIF